MHANIRPRFAALAAASATAVLLAAADKDARSAARRLDAGRTDPPCVVVWHEDSYRPAEQRNAGLVLAVWEDGTLLFPASTARLGAHMLVGRAAPEDVAVVLRAVREAGFHKLKRDYVVPDAAYTTITVRTTREGAAAATAPAAPRDGDGGAVPERVAHAWHGSLNPGFGGDVATDAEYRAFVRAWKRTRGALEGLAPEEVYRLQDVFPDLKEFRGYDLAEPNRTAWRR